MLAKSEYKIDSQLNEFFVAHIRSCYFCLMDGDDCLAENCPKFDDLHFLIDRIQYHCHKCDYGSESQVEDFRLS